MKSKLLGLAIILSASASYGGTTKPLPPPPSYHAPAHSRGQERSARRLPTVSGAAFSPSARRCLSGAGLGAGIGNAIRHARSYDQCMAMLGYARDGQ